MPFSVVGKSSGAIDEWWEDGRVLWLNWPAEIWAQGDDEDRPLLLFAASFASPRGNGFTMFVSPSGLGGSFNWTNSCCAVSGSGYYFTYNCNGDCSCHGCAATGYFSYEGYRLPAWGGSCGCSGEDDDDPDDDDPDDPPAPVGVSVCFSKSAIIFEDAYANSPGQVIGRRSTVAELTCSACGGDFGGSYEFTVEGIDKLRVISGGALPTSGTLAAGESFERKILYEAEKPSDSEDDITVSGVFTENSSDERKDSSDELTVVKVKTRTEFNWPVYRQRKILGVGEEALLIWEPQSLSCQITGAANSDAVYRAPHRAATETVNVGFNGVELPFVFQTFEPQEKVALDAEGVGSSCPGTAGGIQGAITLSFLPTNVSFAAVEFIEIGRRSADPVGYFTNETMSAWLDHSLWGANSWHSVLDGNMCYDNVSLPVLAPPWRNGGAFTWPIPNAWRVAGDNGVTNYLSHLVKYDQRFELDSDGTSRILKMECVFEATTNCDFTVTGGAR